MRVCAAFFDFGLRNAGTPLDIASTPASTTAPDENARRSRSRLTDPVNDADVGALVLGELLGQLLVAGMVPRSWKPIL